MITKNRLAAEKFYIDNVNKIEGGTIWYPHEEDPESGRAFDFDMSDIDDLIALLNNLKLEDV